MLLYWLLQVALPSFAAPPGFGDIDLAFLPSYEVVYSRLASGIFPLWNPWNLAGQPRLGPVQTGTFYPPHLLYLVLPVRFGLAASNALHLVFAALTMALLARRIGLGSAAAAVAGMLFALHGAMVSYLAWTPLVEATAWLPLGCLGVLEIVHRSRPRGVLLLALACGMSLLAGFTQVTVYQCYAWALLLLVELVAGRRPARDWASASFAAAAGILLGAALGGIQLAPAVELALHGNRRLEALSAASMAADAGVALGASVLLSLGAVGSTLIGIGVPRSQLRSIAAWAILVIALALHFAGGSGSALFGGMLALPGMGWFRNPTRIILLAHFAFALLAAIGLDAILAASQPQRRALLLAGAAIPALLVAALALWNDRTGAAALALLTGAAALTLLIDPRPRTRAWIGAGLVLFVAIEVWRPPSPAPTLPYGEKPVALYAARRDTLASLAQHTRGERVLWLGRAAHHRKLATLERVRLVQDYEAQTPRRAAEYFSIGNPPLFMGALGVPTAGSEARARARVDEMSKRLDAAAVRFVFAPRHWLDRPGARELVAERPLLPRPFPDAAYVLFENPHAVPRAYAVYRVEPAPPAGSLLKQLGSEDFDPLERTYLEVAAPSGLTVRAGGLPGHAVSIVSDEETVVELEVELATPGFVVLTDAFHPGWTAHVDGEPTPILAANHLFRAVAVPAGRHRIRFAYRPWSVALGAGATLAGAGVFAVLWRRSRTGRGRQPSS